MPSLEHKLGALFEPRVGAASDGVQTPGSGCRTGGLGGREGLQSIPGPASLLPPGELGQQEVGTPRGLRL